MSVNAAFFSSFKPKFVVCKEQIRNVSTPFLIHFIRSEVLFQLIFKYLVRLSSFITRFFRADDGTQTEFCVHIFVYDRGAVIISPACQINRHAPVAENSIDLIGLLIGILC